MINIATGIEVAFRTSLPAVFRLPGGLIAVMDKIGQVIPDAAAPTHKLVVRVIVDNSPGNLYAPAGETITYDAQTDRVIVTKEYPAEPNLSPPVKILAKAYVRAALAQMGVLDKVEAAITNPVLKILWEDANEVRNDDPRVVELAGALNIDLNAVFAVAEAIKDGGIQS